MLLVLNGCEFKGHLKHQVQLQERSSVKATFLYPKTSFLGSLDVLSKEASLGLLVDPGTLVFIVSPGLCQLQCETETSNSLVRSVRKAQKGKALF